MPEVVPFMNSVLLTVLAAVLGILTTAFWNRRSRRTLEGAIRREAEDAVKARLTELESKLQVLNQAVVPISAAFQAILIKELTHFHTPEMDALMEKIGPPSRLTLQEEQRLFRLLNNRATELNGEIPVLERDAATMLPMVMRRAKAEQDSLVVDVQVVALPASAEEAAVARGEKPSTESGGTLEDG